MLTTEDVKTLYGIGAYEMNCDDESDGPAFDRWLAAEKAQAWYEGSVIGYDCGRVDERMFHAYAVPTNNPYRTTTVRLRESDQDHTPHPPNIR